MEIPRELREQQRWAARSRNLTCGWASPGRPDRPAYTLEPATWGTFERANTQGYSPVGFALTADCPYSVVEVDDGLGEQAKAIIAELSSYAERLDDETGVRVIVRGKLPCGTSLAVAGGVKVYDRLRFVPVSGRHLAGTPAGPQDAGDRLRCLMRRRFPGVPPVTPEANLSDEEVVERATNAYGEKFTRLLTDDQADGEGGLALARHLAYWTGRDPDRMRRLFEGFWPERGRRLNFLEPTLRTALEGLPSGKDVPVEMVPLDDPAVQKALAMAERLDGEGRPLWRAVFDLARHLLLIGGDPRRLRPAVDAFAGRLGFDADECWGRFRQDWDKVRHPDGLFEQAVRLADEEPVPAPADYSDRYRRLAGIAFHLGRMTEGGVFFLSQPKLAGVLGTTQRSVSNIIDTLRKDGYIVVVEEKYTFGHGQANRAKSYRWTG